MVDPPRKGLDVSHTCDMTHSYVWYDSFIRVTWLIHMCDMTHSYVWHDSFICMTVIFLAWLIPVCDKTRSYMWHDSFICLTWLVVDPVRKRGGFQSYVCHCPFIRVTVIFVAWLIHTCDMTHLYVWHDSVMRVTWLIICVTWLTIYVTWLMVDPPRKGLDVIYTCDITHLYVWRESFICVAWLIHT